MPLIFWHSKDYRAPSPLEKETTFQWSLFRAHSLIQRYFLHLAYHGEAYHGWQRQPKVVSIQEILETALSNIFKSQISITGCGRTDRGVHARQFFAHVDLKDTWDFDLCFRLNKNLPHDIVVYDIFPVKEDAHARYDATSRRYDYYFHLNANPFLDRISTHYVDDHFDASAIHHACKLLTQFYDFQMLCKTPEQHPSTHCRLSDVNLYTHASGTCFKLSMSSSRFLRGMIRILVQELFYIAGGMSIEERWKPMLCELIKKPFTQIAPAQGLYLTDITYPYFDCPPQADHLSWHDEHSWQVVT